MFWTLDHHRRPRHARAPSSSEGRRAPAAGPGPPAAARNLAAASLAPAAAFILAACASGGSGGAAERADRQAAAERDHPAVQSVADAPADAPAGRNGDTPNGDAGHGAARADERGAGHGGTDDAAFLEGLGDHHRTISTRSDLAQRYFDQGLRLEYAFNHAEAIRSYEMALEHDPTCAMCLWGIALAYGPNINLPMDSASGAKAYDAIREANRLVDEGEAEVSEVERALIHAVAARYGPRPLEARAARDSAYARAMAAVAEEHADDADVLTLYASSLMNLSPWNYWTGEYEARRPRPDTPDILGALERALELDPDNPGACHNYIHAVEAAFPARAEPCADRLASLMPGAGHIVHMPGHIYIRVGRYADAVTANEHAVHSDETYIADQQPKGVYPLAYYPHNYHFMAFAATMAGMSEKALYAARSVAPKVPIELAEQVVFLQNVVILPQLTHVTFGRWEEVLAEPMPPARLAVASVVAHYARGTAHAALGHADRAQAELEEIRRLAPEAAASGEGGDPNPVIGIAEHALMGEIALRAGDAAGAVAHFQAAAELEDGLLYEEPPLWYYPIRHALGRALLEAGRPAEAERAYREDLARFPENGWSLLGLAQALEAQGKTEEAVEARQAFDTAWAHADVELTSSRI